MQLPYLVDWSPRQRRQKTCWWQESVNTLLATLVTPSAGLDIVQRQVFPWQRYQGLSPVGLRRIQEGGKVNNGVKMDRGPVIFTSDVFLPKDNKSASEVNKSQLGN